MEYILYPSTVLFSTAVEVTIEITYSSPGTYPVYSPPNYRAASAVTLKCVASGYSGFISYHWTSTCTNCFASNSSSQTISNSGLRYRDAGVHTCSVTDGLGNTGSNSTTMRIVGKFALSYAVLLIYCLTFNNLQVLVYMCTMLTVAILQLVVEEHSHPTALQLSIPLLGITQDCGCSVALIPADYLLAVSHFQMVHFLPVMSRQLIYTDGTTDVLYWTITTAASTPLL